MINNSTEKLCRKCNLTKPMSDFNIDNSRKDGKNPSCKKCICEYNRRNYQNVLKPTGYYSTAKFKKDVKLRSANLKEKRKGANLCIQCGKNPPRSTKTKCQNCSERTRNYTKKAKAEAAKKSFCLTCYKFPQVPNYIFCEDCYFRLRAKDHLKDSSRGNELRKKLIEQNYRCPYSGKNLIIGQNTSLDHILPQSKFPELKYEISNLQWVDSAVNQMKQNLVAGEFLELVKQIHNNCNL